MREQKTVRVTGAKRDTYWYVDLIGEEFPVQGPHPTLGYTLIDEVHGLHIREEDCEVISTAADDNE